MLDVAIALALAVAVKPVSVVPDSGAPVRVACPVGATTRIVFPWPARVSVSPGGREALGIEIESLKEGRIAATPRSHPGDTLMSIRSLNGQGLTLRLHTVPSGEASEIRLVLRSDAAPGSRDPAAASTVASARSAASTGPAPSRVAPGGRTGRPRSAATPPPPLAAATPPASPTPVASPPATSSEEGGVGRPAVPASPTMSRTAEDAAVATLPTPSFDIQELLTLRPEEIGRREGLPGELPVVLEDALRSPANIWLRFRVEGGSERTLKRIEWERGPIRDVIASPAGKDLRVVVRLPRAEVTRRTRVTIQLSDGASYRFALSAPWLSARVKGLLF